MGFLIRALLIWLLVLAIPAQGVAAATMMFCGPGHHDGGVATAAQASGAGEHAHHDSDGQAEQAEHGAKKCSACASCCSIGAMLSPALAVPQAAVAPTVFNAVVVTVDPFAADGPDRPPRIVLA